MYRPQEENSSNVSYQKMEWDNSMVFVAEVADHRMMWLHRLYVGF